MSAPPFPRLSRETQIRRDAHGVWWNGEERISHANLVEAFNRWLERDEDGRYLLRNDVNWAYVTVAGPPLFVRRLRLTDRGATLGLSDGREESLEPRSLRQDGQGRLYCDVRAGTMAARFDREAMGQLEPLLGEDELGVYIELSGCRYRPPVVLDPLEVKREGTTS